MSTQQTKGPMALELERRVAAARAKDPDKSRAQLTLDAFRADEAFRQRWLAETNGTPPPAAPAAPVGAVARFEAAIKARVNAGMTRPAALEAIVQTDPKLHADYLAEFNARHQARPKPRQ